MRQSLVIASPLYRDAFRVAMIQQLPTAVLCGLLLDGGGVARICGIAMAGFWAGTLLGVARRPFAPTPADLALIRWGFLPMFAATLAVAVAVN